MDLSAISSLETLSQNPSARVIVKSDLFAPGRVPLNVWIETTQVSNHPRTVRRLKANSACVVHDLRDAKYIIVNGSSLAGRKLLRDWGSDTSKVFLDSAWVQRSLDAGRPLLESDQYGHCRLFDDGKSIPDEDDDYDEVRAPKPFNPPSAKAQLPTPRPTPTMVSSMSNVVTPSIPGQLSSTANPVLNNGSELLTRQQSQLVLPFSWSQLASSPIPVPVGQQSSPPTGQMAVMLRDPNYMAMFEFFLQQYTQQLQYQLLPQPQPQQVQLQSQSIQDSISTNNLYFHSDAGSISTSSQLQTQAPSIAHHSTSTHTAPRPSGSELPASRENSPIQTTGISNIAPPLKRTEPGIFEEELGCSLKFFVQIQIKNRTQISKAIKRHGGRIVSSISEAHFAILNTRGADFDSLRTQADHHGVPSLNPSFVVDSDSRKTFLNTTDYVIPSAVSENSQRKKRKPTGGLSTKSKTKPYTPEEREFFSGYVERTLRNIPDTSFQTLASLLQKKIPAHSYESWLWFCRHNKTEIEEIRAKCSKKDDEKKDPRQPKAEPGEIKLQNPPNVQAASMPSPPSSMSRPPKLEPRDLILPKVEEGKRQDFDFVRDFFASGAGDHGTEEDVWATMSARQSCRTASTWKDFCAEHCDQIAKEQKELALKG